MSGRSESCRKYLMDWERPSSLMSKSSLVRLLTMAPFLSRAVASTSTTLTSDLIVVEAVFCFSGVCNVSVVWAAPKRESAMRRKGRGFTLTETQVARGSC